MSYISKAPSSLLGIGGATRKQSQRIEYSSLDSDPPCYKTPAEKGRGRPLEPGAASVGGKGGEAHSLSGPGIELSSCAQSGHWSRNKRRNNLFFRC